MSDLPAPLEGIRVLDLTRIISGPICGRMLADLGADVIKVESFDGDLTRAVPPVVDGIGALFAHMNAGKRNLALDLRAEGGAALVARLASQVDVLIENFRPGALRRRGLAYRDLRSANPRLIYCSITGFGQDGPWVDRRAHAPLLHGEAGVIEVASRLRDQPPVPEVHQHGDLYSGFFSVSAIVAALFQREREGVGQHLDIAMAEVLLYTNDQIANDLTGFDGRREFDTWTYGIWSLADGSTICLVGNPERLLPVWWQPLGGDAADMPVPVDHNQAHAALAPLLAKIANAEDLVTRLEGVPGAVSKVLPATDLVASEWGQHRGLVIEAAPGIEVPAMPWRSSAAQIGPAGAAAAIGAHTDTILDEFGLDEAEIRDLHHRGVVR